jgi:hypothetical protein
MSQQKGEYFCFHSTLCKILHSHLSEYVAVCVNIHINIFRDALIATYPNIKTLMCYFYVVNCCKKNLRSHPAATQKRICDDIYHLYCSVSEVEFEGRYRVVSAR